MLHERIGLPNKCGVAAGYRSVPFNGMAWRLAVPRITAPVPLVQTAIVVALITIPMYWQARRHGPISNPVWTLGRWGHPVMLALALLALILMAAGSLVSVN